jgi:hypothetical protein
MQTIPNVSSEEELLQLREEGKISEAEYQDLRSAMSRSTPAPEEPIQTQPSDAAAKHKRGKTALTIMFFGLALPALGFGILALMLARPNQSVAIGPWFFLAVAFQIVAFALGVSAWPNAYAKATVITISVISVFVLLICILHAWTWT